MKMVRRTPNGRRVVYTPKDGDIWTDPSTGKTYVFFERSHKWVLERQIERIPLLEIPECFKATPELIKIWEAVAGISDENMKEVKENKIKTDLKRTPQEEEDHREILRTIFYTDYEDEF